MTSVSVPSTIAIPLLWEPTTFQVRPGYEGANIGPWIGFKHVNYLVEEAVLNHFREQGLPARELYERYGLGLDVVELDTRILHALRIDEVVTARVIPLPSTDNSELAATVVMEVDRAGRTTKAVTAKARATLRRDHGRALEADPPPEIQPFIVDRISGIEDTRHSAGAVEVRPADAGSNPVLNALLAGRNGFGWKLRMPYFYCHFTDRVQMSGYLRVMEESVDLFLADRGISIRTMLNGPGWVPVVPHSRIRLLGETAMEEDLYIVLTVEDVFKDLTHTCRMDCHVVRDGTPVRTATGEITHGYAVIENDADRPAMRLVNFDERVLQALRGHPHA